jgi:hypothetical protein
MTPDNPPLMTMHPAWASSSPTCRAAWNVASSQAPAPITAITFGIDMAYLLRDACLRTQRSA